MKYIVSKDYKGDLFKTISVQESIELLDKMGNIIGIDTETLGLDCHSDKITLLQFGTIEDQLIIDCVSTDITNYKGILESENIVKVGANLKFDLQFFYKNNIFPRNLWDILLAEYVLYNGLNEERLKDIYIKFLGKDGSDVERKKLLHKANLGWYSLMSLVFVYTGNRLNKSVRENFNDYLSEIFLQYSAKDVEYLLPVYLKQKELAKKDGCIKAINLENEFLEPLAYIEFCGLGIDVDKWNKLYEFNKAKCDDCLNKLNKYIYDKNLTKYQDLQLDLFSSDNNYKVLINWDSQPQLLQLFKELGVNTVDADGNISINEKVLKPQKDKCDLIPLFLEYSEYQKLASTYGKDFLKYVNKTTGRIHCDYTQLVSTSRLSSSKPNLQNIPATSAFRETFIAKPNNKFVSCDYNGQESNLLVNASKEPKLIEFYQKGLGDLHSYVAKLTFPDEIGDTPIEDVKAKFKSLRQLAKTVEFAVAYGGTGFTISKNVGIAPEEGERIYNQYMSAFSGLKDYFEKVGRFTKQHGYVLISEVTGRKFWINNYNYFKNLEKAIQDSYDRDSLREYNKISNKIQRLSQNYPIQGRASEVTKLAIIWFFRWIRMHKLWNKVLIVGAVHDEILVEYPEELTMVPDILRKCMEKASENYCPIIPLEATPEVGNFWIH